MEVDKLLAAKNQLNESIRLFFEGRDPISVHTLAFAAHQLLFDLSNSRRPSAQFISGLKDSYGAPKQLTKKWHNILNKAANFFKHADKDPSAKLEFDPKVTAVFLLDCTFMLQTLMATISTEAAVFRMWFFLKYPDFLVDGSFKINFSKLTNDLVDPDDLPSFRRFLDKATL